MEHRGYYAGKVTFDDDAGIFHGEVVGTRDVITFQGKSAAQLKKAFQDSVNDISDQQHVATTGKNPTSTGHHLGRAKKPLRTPFEGHPQALFRSECARPDNI